MEVVNLLYLVEDLLWRIHKGIYENIEEKRSRMFFHGNALESSFLIKE